MKSPYTDSLAHTTWECKYHIVFAPKFRRKEIYGTLRREIGMILRELCKRKDTCFVSKCLWIDIDILLQGRRPCCYKWAH